MQATVCDNAAVSTSYLVMSQIIVKCWGEKYTTFPRYLYLVPFVRKVDSAIYIHPINPYPLDNAISFPHTYPLDNNFYYIDADEIPGFFLLLKNHIFVARGEDTIFIF